VYVTCIVCDCYNNNNKTLANSTENLPHPLQKRYSPKNVFVLLKVFDKVEW